VTMCRNSGCYKKLPLDELKRHEQYECRRAVVYCRIGCGLTTFNEKRNMHETEMCEMRFVNCPLCDKKVREKEKFDHMDIECVRRQV
jgi:hypothetical protein